MRHIEHTEDGESVNAAAIDRLLARTTESVERTLGQHVDVEARLEAFLRRVAEAE
jgi:hypothetical protein